MHIIGRRRFAWAVALVPSAAFAQSAPEPSDAQIAAFEACIAGVDGEAIDAFSEEILERNSDITTAIDEACAAGRRDEAAALYAPLMSEYTAHPEVRKLRACVAEMDAARGIVADDPHVCDEE